ncbi:unnamed protein product [Toxocara canis]|uniref:BZIP domain-containing protein n=1 Tax=Toxocara canis TaxID=6265 RepID=A0A183URV8_TOXCA|nr:unnamed protein product [Toxocara canis]
MNEIASPNSTCAQLAVEPTPLVITATPPKKKGGRPRKEDAAQKEQELSSEAKAKRDKRRQDNLLAAARYRQKKDEAIKILTQQLQARENEVNEKYAKILELRERIERLEASRQQFNEQLAELRAKWDSEMSSIINATQSEPILRTATTTMNASAGPARAVILMPFTRNPSSAQAHAYALPNSVITTPFKEPSEIVAPPMRPPQMLRQITNGTTAVSNPPSPIIDPASIKRLPKQFPNDYVETLQQRIDAHRQTTPPIIDGFARNIIAPPMIREAVSASTTAHLAATLNVRKIYRDFQDEVAVSLSSMKEQSSKFRTFAHRKGRPRLDETHSVRFEVWKCAFLFHFTTIVLGSSTDGNEL